MEQNRKRPQLNRHVDKINPITSLSFMVMVGETMVVGETLVVMVVAVVVIAEGSGYAQPQAQAHGGSSGCEDPEPWPGSLFNDHGLGAMSPLLYDHPGWRWA